MKPALIIGSTCLDVILHIDHLPKTEENIRPTSQTMALGGCAYNVASTMHNLDCDHDLCVPVGNGMYASIVRKKLLENGYPILIQDETSGNSCLCPYSGRGKRMLLLPGRSLRRTYLHVLPRSRIYLPEILDGALSG